MPSSTTEQIISISQLPPSWQNEYERILYKSQFPGCKTFAEREAVALDIVLKAYRKEQARLDALKEPDLFCDEGSFNPDNKRKNKRERA